MNTLYRLAHTQWLGPVLLIFLAVALPMAIVNSELFWAVAIASVVLGVWGLTLENRWIVALPAIFALGLLAFNLRTLGFPISTVALLLVLGIATAVTLWLIPTSTQHDVVLSYAGGLGLLEVFFILVFWPINFASRSLIFTAAAFLIFELLEQRKHESTPASLLGSIGLSLVAMLVVILTADWQSF